MNTLSSLKNYWKRSIIVGSIFVFSFNKLQKERLRTMHLSLLAGLMSQFANCPRREWQPLSSKLPSYISGSLKNTFDGSQNSDHACLLCRGHILDGKLSDTSACWCETIELDSLSCCAIHLDCCWLLPIINSRCLIMML